MEFRFEYLNISHTSCCLFLWDIFEINRNYNTNQNIIQLLKCICRDTTNLHNVSCPESFSIIQFYLVPVKLTPFLLGQYT